MLKLVKKKYKGNTLLLAIIVSMVLIITGTLVTTAVMNSTNLNINKRINNELYYAAESGLELGQSIIANQVTVSQNIINALGGSVDIKLLNNFDSNIEYVKVTGKKISNTEIEVTSIAKKKNSFKSFTLVGIIKKTGGPLISSLYEYSLASNELEVILAGGSTSMDFVATKVGSKASKLDLELWDISSTPRELILPAIAHEDIEVSIPTMNFSRPIGVTIPPVNEISLEVGGAATINSALDTKVLAGSIGIKKLILPLGVGRELKVYLVDTNYLYISNQSGNNSLLEDSIIICSGEIIVAEDKNKIAQYQGTNPITGSRDTFSTTLLKYNRSTMIAEKLTIYGGTFHCAYPLVVKDPSGYVTHGILQTDGEVNNLNSILESEMSGWSSAGGSVAGGMGEWGMIQNTEYK